MRRLAALASTIGIFAACGPRAVPIRDDCRGSMLLGSCPTTALERTLCDGKRAHGGACEVSTCRPGDAPLDVGGCVPKDGLRAFASHPNLALVEGERLECPPESTLIGVARDSGPQGLCLPVSSCPLGSRWAKGRCQALPLCGARSAFDEVDGSCRPFLVGGDDAVFDVGAWVHAVLGPDGGRGSSYLCGGLQRHAFEVGAPVDGVLEVPIAITLRFEGGDPRIADVFVKTQDPGHAAWVERTVRPLLELGTTSASRTTATLVRSRVRCTVTGPRTPDRVPPTAASESRVGE